MLKLRTFIPNVKRLIKWIPVIWEDREWDYNFLYRILDFKIKNMQEFYESGKSIIADEEVNKTISEMKEVRKLINRVSNHDYLEESLKEFNKKYPSFIEESMNFEPTEDGKFYTRVSKASQESEDEFKKASDISEQNKNNDMDKLFKLLRDNIEGWWE